MWKHIKNLKIRSRELLVSSCIGYSHFRFDKLFTKLTMEPFAEKPIDNLASTSFCTYRVRGVSGGASLKFNAIRHGRETAEIGLNPETAEIVCNALTSVQRMRRG